MPRPRHSDDQKKFSGSYTRTRSEETLLHGRTAITTLLPPPSDLDKDARRHWQIYMPLLVARRILSASDLPAFVALVQASAARERAYKIAMRKGPTTSTAAGGEKPSAAWQLYLAADAAYSKWTSVFGLNPRWAASAISLPVSGPGELRAVE